VVLREGRKARAALWQAREDFDAARRYAHSHPDNELAWVALRLALDVLGRAAAAAAAPLDSSGG
jgi:hypothetical protein